MKNLMYDGQYWRLDSDTTIHVCFDKNQFKTHVKVKEPEKVLMGNHVNANVSRKGIVEINVTSGHKLTLLNLYHVHEMKKNLVSASLLSKKVVATKCVPCNASIYIVECDSLLWHARLGHITFCSLNYMFKNGYIARNNKHAGKCELCIQAKMTTEPFRIVEGVIELLDLVHPDICEFNGELIRGGKRYFIIFIDDFSRFTLVYLLRTKDDAFKNLQQRT